MSLNIFFNNILPYSTLGVMQIEITPFLEDKNFEGKYFRSYGIHIVYIWIGLQGI